MSIGAGIFLLVVGAILAFAVQDSWAVMDLTMIGYILMAGGALGLLIGVILMTRKNKVSSVTRKGVTADGQSIVESETATR